MRVNTLFMLSLLLTGSVAMAAQNYYPMDVGNTWVLESQDGAERSTYTVEETGEQVRLLKMTTETLGTEVTSTDRAFVEVAEDGLKLHKIVSELGSVFGAANVEFSPPATFFPFPMKLGTSWELEGTTDVNLLGPVTITTTAEVIALEDVVTPAGTFKHCFKIRLRSKTRSAFSISRSTLYQWLAPDIGPVRLETDQDIVFALVSFHLANSAREGLPTDVTGDGIVNILDLTFVASRIGQTSPEADVNNDGVVNMLDLVLIAQNFTATL